jgi:hypothetical protein
VTATKRRVFPQVFQDCRYSAMVSIQLDRGPGSIGRLARVLGFNADETRVAGDDSFELAGAGVNRATSGNDVERSIATQT